MNDIERLTRPDQMSLRPKRQSPLALWVVIVSGLVLTIASYALLLVFINDTNESDRMGTRRDLQQTLNTQVQQIDREFDMVAMLASVDTDGTSFKQMFADDQSQSEMVSFNQILWLPLQDITAASSRLLYARSGITPALTQGIIDQILPKFSRLSFSERQKSNVFSLAGNDRVDLTSVYKTDGRPIRIHALDIAFIRQIDGPRAGLIVALMSGEKIVPSAWLRQRNFIDQIEIFERGQPDRLYHAFRVDRMDDVIYTPSRSVSSTPMSAPLWNIQMDINLYLTEVDQIRMLTYLPNLLLVFGLVLTFMGAAFVISNQRQALMAANMNRTLALKNMELNSQVTERERLNQILRKTERENRAIIHAVSDIIFELDKDGRVLFVNDAWERITGFDTESAKKYDFFSLLEPDHQDDHRQDFIALIRGQKQVYRFVTKIRTASERYRMVEVAFSMIRMDDNKSLRVVGTITDIEERRQAETALAEAERKYRTIWENAASAIYQMTPEGQLLSANPAYARIFGYDTPHEMIAAINNANRQLYASLKDRQTMIRDIMLHDHIQNVETQGVKRDHSLFWLRESTRVVKDADDNVMYFEGSIDDISEQKESELKLRTAMTESEMANRSKTEFLANMSHELRTPLNSIIGFSQIIRDEVLGKLEQRQYWEYARDIHESGRYLLSIINTILDIAKIEAGERDLNENLADIRGIMLDAVDLVTPKAEANQQQIDIQAPDVLPRLVCEEVAIKQVLINLLSNAVKFTPQGGHITLSADIENDGALSFSVTDTGIGMDEDELARVMAPFGQSTGSFSRSSSGPGLGLTLVNSLVRLHGGRFEIVSKKGLGTTVSVILPANRLVKQG